MSDPILTYFIFRGLGEPIRLLLHDLGLAFEDRRVNFGEEWDGLKPQMQFGQMPRLQIGDLTLFQSQAILRHLARTHGLVGETEAERIRCDVSAEAARDLQQALWDHLWSPGSDAPSSIREFEDGRLAGALEVFAAWLGERPYLSGERPLFADYYAVTVIDEATAFYPRAVAKAPTLGAYAARMAARPGIAAYIASGGQPEGYGFDPIRGIRRPAALATG
jgi:glutathione S-transferase